MGTSWFGICRFEYPIGGSKIHNYVVIVHCHLRARWSNTPVESHAPHWDPRIVTVISP